MGLSSNSVMNPGSSTGAGTAATGADGTLAATVYNDKEGQAAAMANLAFSIATEDENNPNPFKNYKYIYRAYQKVTKENVQTFLEKEE